MAHAIGGNGGNFKVAGSLATGKFKKWRVVYSNKNVDDRGGGEAWASVLSIHNNWEFEATALVTAISTPDYASLVGTEVAIAGMILAADATPQFLATGLIERFEQNHDIENPSDVTIRAICSTGAAPTNV